MTEHDPPPTIYSDVMEKAISGPLLAFELHAERMVDIPNLVDRVSDCLRDAYTEGFVDGARATLKVGHATP